MKLVRLPTFNRLELELKALHTLHPLLALEGCLPSTQHALMFEVEVFSVADGVGQFGAFSFQVIRPMIGQLLHWCFHLFGGVGHGGGVWHQLLGAGC